MNRKIQRLLDDRALEVVAVNDEEVAEFWRKALRAYDDSRLPALSPEGALTRRTSPPSPRRLPSSPRRAFA